MGQTKARVVNEETVKTKMVVSKNQKKAKVRGKKYILAKKKIDMARLYSAKEAVSLVKETSIGKFDGTIELHLVVRKIGHTTSVELPHATGKSKRVEVADEDTVKKLEGGKIDFDILLATPDIIPKLVPFARILGPKGLMPNPKNGTIIKSAKDAEKFNANKLAIKTEKGAPLIHTIIGKVSMKDSELLENLEAILTAVNKKSVVKAYLSASMGPSVKILVD